MGQAWFKLLSDTGPTVAKAHQVIAIPGDPFLHSVLELPAKAVNVMVVVAVSHNALGAMEAGRNQGEPSRNHCKTY